MCLLESECGFKEQLINHMGARGFYVQECIEGTVEMYILYLYNHGVI